MTAIPTFAYERPVTLAEASALLSREGAVALAGGTDLVVGIRKRHARPALVVDLKSVAEIPDTIEVVGDRLRIGGRVVMSRVTTDEHVRRHFPALVDAAAVVGSIQIRNRATIAGNVCNASPAADTAPALLAYSATVTIAGTDGPRAVPLDEFYLGPGSIVLGRGEIVTSIDLPIPTPRVGSAFARVTRIRGIDLASVAVACAVAPSGAVRFGFGAVGPTPLLSETTREALSSDDGWSRLLAVASPISDVRAGADYREAMLRSHSRRALQEAIDDLEAGS
jgi:CO/xanthine dehydrogenase FAD-binding subunit